MKTKIGISNIQNFKERNSTSKGEKMVTKAIVNNPDDDANTNPAKGEGLLETLLKHLQSMPKLNKKYDHTQTVAENDEQ